jgi:hypothetical protein
MARILRGVKGPLASSAGGVVSFPFLLPSGLQTEYGGFGRLIYDMTKLQLKVFQSFTLNQNIAITP